MEKAWSRAQKSIFRLELLPEYKVPEDLILFKKWKSNNFSVELELDGWLKDIRATKEKGVKIQRVRVTPLPIPKYIHYEIDCWEYSKRAGEEILFLSEDTFKRIQTKSDFVIEDYWMFDDEVLVIFHYEKGDLIEERMIKNRELIKKHQKLKVSLLEQTIPMKKFLQIFK